MTDIIELIAVIMGMPAMLRIDQVDMYYRDQRALEILQSRVNGASQRAEITHGELALLLQCGDRTATRITDRLQQAGYIRKHGRPGKGGYNIEVLQEESEGGGTS